MKVKVEIENHYSDGHESRRTVELESPAHGSEAAAIAWLEDAAYPHTGDGHGISFDGGSCYTATIVECPDDPTLVGIEMEWID